MNTAVSVGLNSDSNLSSKEDWKTGSRKDAECKDEKCPKCQQEAETAQHWRISCPTTISKRQRIFGDDNISLWVMTREPELVLAYAKETLYK